MGSALKSASSGPMRLYDDQLEKKDATEGEGMKAGEDDNAWTPAKGDTVKIKGLAKAAQYNGLEGVIYNTLDPETERCGVRIEYNDKSKTLALQIKNMTLMHKAKKAKHGNASNAATSPGEAAPPAEPPMSKAMALLQDPEIKAMVDSNPKFKDAVED